MQQLAAGVWNRWVAVDKIRTVSLAHSILMYLSTVSLVHSILMYLSTVSLVHSILMYLSTGALENFG